MDKKPEDVVLTAETRAVWSQKSFWEHLLPPEVGPITEGSRPTTTSSSRKATPEPWVESIEDASAGRWRKLLREQGFALVDPVINPSLLAALRQGLEALHQKGLPATFIFLWDVAWELADGSRELLQRSTRPGHQFHFDLLAWNIQQGGGFSPHRDRQPEPVADSFEDDEAKLVTHWIAVTEATPENSCLYVIPRPFDPGYLAGDDDSMDPLRRALPHKQAYQRIRALPRTSGQSVLFTHRLIHWGSERAAESTQPARMALSFVSSDPSFEKPYVDPKYFTANVWPPFRIRLLLVCAQMLIYYQRFDLPQSFLRACFEFCKAYENELEESYRHKVFLEFIHAGQEEYDEDQEEAVLTAMLDAEEEGYGDALEDDFDAHVGRPGQQEECDDPDDFEEEEGDDHVDLFGKPTKRSRTDA